MYYPHEAKTGTGPILLTCSFPYVRDWLNEHSFKNTPEARLICNLHTGGTQYGKSKFLRQEASKGNPLAIRYLIIVIEGNDNKVTCIQIQEPNQGNGT
ncbi:MAG: hypothetical protein WAM14_22695 [Candidatus Nitrosopolaris sp.]